MKANDKARTLIGNVTVDLLEKEGIVLLHESELNFLKMFAKINASESENEKSCQKIFYKVDKIGDR